MSITLSETLPLLATAPDGIQKLRGLILELAVRGKLVPQDPNDERASELLKRVDAERRQLKLPPRLPVDDAPSPFSLPEDWQWVRFGDVAQHNSGKTLDKGRNSGHTRRYITTSNLYWGRFDLANVREMLIRDEELERCTARRNDLLICEGGEAGRSAVWDIDEEICFQNHVHRARFFAGINPCYAYRTFQRLDLSGEINEFRKGVGISNLSGKALASIPFPLPPLAEQHRIVAKVDELMALCDRLEAEQTDAEAAHAKLVGTLLGTLTQSTESADLVSNWQRLAEHFDTLFFAETSLDALKQTILQLAVMGKLVPQDPNDEPATRLLERIQKSRRFKRKAVSADFEELEIKQPGLPNSWTWTVVDQVAADEECSITDGPFGANLKTEHYVAPSGYRVIRLQNIGRAKFRGEHHAYITKQRFDALIKHQVLAGDLVVAGLVDEDQGIRCCRLPQDIGPSIVKADCYRFSVHSEVNTDFALIFLNAPLSSVFASSHHHGMTLTRIGLGNFRRLPFPLPPLAEQHRIVAKVDELMALCDLLKNNLIESRNQRARLATTLIQSALKAA